MKVVQLGPYPPPQGGVQSHIVGLRRLILARGGSCNVINLTRHRESRETGVFHPTTARETLVRLWGFRAWVLHLHVGLQSGTKFPRRLLWLGLACTLLAGRRTIFTFHSGGYPESEEGRAAKPGTLAGFVFRRFGRVVGVNPALARLFERYGVRPDRIRMIPPHALPAMPQDRDLPERIAAFFAAHRPVLLSVGLLEPEYDLRLQIDLVGPLRRHYPDAGLVMAGSGSLEQALRQKIGEQPWREHILLPGDLPHAVVLRAMLQASVLLRTTIADGDSVSVREALHLGLPVVASDNGMRPGGVHLFPIGDGEALLKTVTECLETPRPVPGSSHDADQHLNAVLQLYEEVAGNR